MKYLNSFRGGAYVLVGMILTVVLMTLAHPMRTFADDLPVVHVAGTLTTDEEWSAGNVYYLDNNVVVPDGITLTVDPGVIIKYGWTGGVSVNVGGILDAQGTTSDPITFTSYKDDSVGGDSNSDGSSTGAWGDSGSIAVMNSGGSVQINHATIRYANYALWAICTPDEGSTVLDDSALNDGVYLSHCPHGAVILRNNSFALPNGLAYNAIDIQQSAAEGVDLSGSNANHFAGTGQNIIVSLFQSQVTAGETWDIAASSGVVVMISSLEVNGTLGISGAAIVKYPSGGAITITSSGTVDVEGGESSPAIFTSYKDDSVGGDSNSDGSSTGGTGDSGSVAFMNNGGSLTIAHAIIRYANAGIWVYGSSTNGISNTNINHIQEGIYSYAGHPETNLQAVDIEDVMTGVDDQSGLIVFRGTISNASSRAISACNWSIEDVCSVDAAYVNWGSVDGPLASNPADNLVCGAVTISPWKYDTSTYTLADDPDVYDVRNCDNSFTPSAQLGPVVTTFQNSIASKEIDCGNGFQDACDAITTAYACLGGAMDVAQSTAPWSVPPASTAEQVNDFGGLARQAAADYIGTQESVSFSGFSFSIANELLNLTNTFITMANAYSSCAP